MRRFTPFLFLFPFLLWGCKKEDSAASGADCRVQAGLGHGHIIEGQYIVYYNPKNIPEGLSKIAARGISTSLFARLGIPAENQIQSLSGAVTGCVARLNQAEVQLLLQDHAVAAVEPDRIMALATCFTVVAPTLVTWGTRRVGFGDGTGKTAWVMDTGIDFTHPDLNVDVNRSRSFIANAATANDDHGHGSHVAGIIGAKNNNFGMLGVASGATLVAVKVLDKDGKGKLSAMIDGLNYVASAARPGDVVNMSLGEEGTSEYLDRMVKNLAAKGILFSIAAGNEGKPAVEYSPGRVNHPNVFTVSAVDSLDNFASFSNHGSDVVDFAAPGVRIVSCFKEGKYARLSGSSMAAPHVAGLLLLNGRIASDGFAKNDPDGVPDPIAHK